MGNKCDQCTKQRYANRVGNEHVTFSYDQARAAISKIEAAISQEQLQSEDKDAALEMLTESETK